MSRITLLSVLACWFCLLVGLPAHAQSAVGVAPTTRLYTAKPGDSLTMVLTLDNPSPKAAVTVRAYLGDWDQDPTGQSRYFPAGSQPRSASNWITLSGPQFTLAPASTQQMRYTVQVPAGAAPGTHWSMLFFESGSEEVRPGQLAAFRVRVAHVIYVNVTPTTLEGRIVGVFHNPPPTPDSPLQVGIQYANSGNAAVAVMGRVELRDARGEVVRSNPIEATVVLPGATQLIASSFYGPLEAGQYSVLAVLNNGSRTQDLAGESVLVLAQAMQPLAPPAISPGPPPAASATQPTPSGGAP